jgi:hypothetical protein
MKPFLCAIGLHQWGEWVRSMPWRYGLDARYCMRHGCSKIQYRER